MDTAEEKKKKQKNPTKNRKTTNLSGFTAKSEDISGDFSDLVLDTGDN